MRPNTTLIALFVTTTLVGACAQAPEPEEADLILHSGSVYTLVEDTPWAEAVAVRDGQIVAVGSNDAVLERYRGTSIDLAGRMLLPGFHDAHVHPVSSGLQLMQCNLAGLNSVALLVDRLTDCDGDLAPDAWLIGGGWNLSLFEEANPSRKVLDAINPDRAMMLQGADGHSSWASSKALQLAGIEKETPAPAHGIIEREPDGTPSGTLRESAQAMLAHVVPQLSDADYVAGLKLALTEASAVGITSMIDAATAPRELSAYLTLEARDELTARLILSTAVVGGGEWAGTADAIRPQDRHTDARLRRHGAKIFVDGVLEGETAALLSPYVGSDSLGMLIEPPEALNATVAALDADGAQIMFHAIGDRAVRAALDAVQHARSENGPADNRHHISHLQLIHPDDYPRFGELGVAANFQSLWAFPDPYITDINLPAVGAERVERMYPLGSIQRAGGTLVGGSDWFVSSLNPLEAIETAITRADASHTIPGVLNAEEQVDLATMLAAYTVNGAVLMNQEDRVGRIAPGMLADLIVLDRNLFDIEPAEISDVRVLLTLLEGEVVYDSGALDG